MPISPSKLLARAQVPCILLSNPAGNSASFYACSGLPFGQYEGALLALKPRGKPVLLVSPLEYDGVKGTRELAVRAWHTSKARTRILKQLVGRYRTVGVEGSQLTLSGKRALSKALPGVRFKDVEKHLQAARAVKDKEEIRSIARAVKITQSILDGIEEILRPNMSARALANKLESAAIEQADRVLAFPTIVASGRNSRVPHYIPGNAKIRKGLLLVDFGVRWKNYCADITRTYHVGRADKKMQARYSVVAKAKEKAQELMMQGVRADKPFLEAEKVLKQHRYKLIHGLGHGLGVAVHDAPGGMKRKEKWKLEAGQVLTVEPGIYARWGGIRIEDDVVVKKQGLRMLSQAPDTLRRIRVRR